VRGWLKVVATPHTVSSVNEPGGLNPGSPIPAAPAREDTQGKSTLGATLHRLRHSAAVLPLAAAAALLLLGVSETAYRSASTSLSELDDRDTVRRRVLLVQRGLIDAETGQRGYLLTEIGRAHV